MSISILGISARFHDAAACILVDGKIIAAAQEERFTRIKHDASLPRHAIRYCLAEADLLGKAIDAVVFYDKPIEKFFRIMESFLCVAPKGMQSFSKVMPSWLEDKLWLPPQIEQAVLDSGATGIGKLFFSQHHESHAASAFYPSPFDEAAILTIDGVGEWATATISIGEGSTITTLKELHFPHSLGMLYSAFTAFCGFKVNSDEYKLMGLAPYGSDRYSKLIKEKIVDIKSDGSFRLNMKYFAFLDELSMLSQDFCDLFAGQPRQPDSALTQREMDIAHSVQVVTEEIVLTMAQHARQLTGKKNLCLAGGVALNCVANGKLLQQGIFEKLWIQPAADDAGGALGAALTVYHNEFHQARAPRNPDADNMQASLLGPVFSDRQISEFLLAQGVIFTEIPEHQRAAKIAALVADGQVIGLFDGRMEFGPRALGCRSIIADPRVSSMQSTLNQKIKFRESFRPFAAAVLEEKMSEYFEIHTTSPYMLLVAKIRESLRLPLSSDNATSDIGARLAQARSILPAITHVDYSCRLQSVNPQDNPRFYAIIKAFEQLTGFGIIINTSFNVRDEPIVCTPSDALRCFMKTGMDTLVMGSFLIMKKDQPANAINTNWQSFFQSETK